MEKRAIVLLADGFELVEAMTVVDYLRRAGVFVETVALDCVDVRSQSDVYVRADRIFSACLGMADAVIIPGGGQGAKILAAHEGVVEMIRKANKSGKIIAAICAGPTVLEKAGVLEGKTGTSYPGFADKLSYKAYVDDLAYTDGNLISSRGPATTIYFAEHIVRSLCGDDVWMDVSHGILQTLVLTN